MVKSPEKVSDLPPIKVKTGTEGCKHDPYGWSEIQVTMPSGLVVWRSSGLGYDRLSHNGVQIGEVFGGKGLDQLEQQFQQLTGMTPEEAESYYYLVWEEDPMGISLGRDIH